MQMGPSILILFAVLLTPELIAEPVYGSPQSDGPAPTLSGDGVAEATSLPNTGTDKKDESTSNSLSSASESKLAAASSQNLVTAVFSNPLSYMLVFLLAFYVLLIIPQQRAMRRQQREQTDRLSNLKKNDRIVTASGIHAVVTNINSEAGTITVRIDESSNAKLTIDRDVVRTVLKGT